MVGFGRILCAVDKSEDQNGRWSTRSRWSSRTERSSRSSPVRPLLLPPALWTGYPVAPPLSPMDPEVEEAQLRAFIHDSVGAALAKVMVREGVIAPEILKAANDLRADLIVMGTDASSGLEHWLLGSVAENVLRHAACPVLTVPRGTAEPPDSLQPRSRPSFAHRLLSRDSERAVELARSLAEAAGGRLVLVHVLEQIGGENPTLTAHFNVAEFRRTLERDARRRLEDSLEPWAGSQWHKSAVGCTGRRPGKCFALRPYVRPILSSSVSTAGMRLTSRCSAPRPGRVPHRAAVPVLTVPRDSTAATAAA